MTLSAEEPGKKRDILRAARALFAARRYDEVSVPEIVKLAGVAQGTFYRYFPSKNALVDALADELNTAVIAAIAPLVSGDRPFVDLLEPLMRAATEILAQYRDILPFINTDALLFSESPLGAQGREPMLALLRQKLRTDQERGRIAADLDLEVASRLVDSTLNRAARDLLLEGNKIAVDDYIRGAAQFLRNALGGKSRR